MDAFARQMTRGDPSEAGQVEASDVDRRIEEAVARVRRAAIARYGGEIGVEVAAEAQAWALANRDQAEAADNLAGLLYRVVQSRVRAHHRWVDRRAPVEMVPEQVVAETRPELVDLYRCLGRLNENQRIAVVMVHAHGERYDTVAELLGVSTAAVTNHVHRGLKKLRSMMEEQD